MLYYAADRALHPSVNSWHIMWDSMLIGCTAVVLLRANATKADFAPVAQFKGFASVKKRDELSLMYAVWKHGPVAISLDASQPSFKFYSEGVYKEKKCLTKKVRACCWVHLVS